MKKKKSYSTVRVSSISLEAAGTVLTGSIISTATITVTGQEVGAFYDFSQKPDPTNEAKMFNHEWE